MLGRPGTASLHPTGIIAKPQGHFFFSEPSAPNMQLSCVVPHGYVRNYARTDIEALSSARRRDSRMPTADVACKRTTRIIMQHTVSIETDRNVSVRFGQSDVANEYKRKEETGQRGREKAESLMRIRGWIIVWTPRSGIARPPRLNCDQGLNGDFQGR